MKRRQPTLRMETSTTSCRSPLPRKAIPALFALAACSVVAIGLASHRTPLECVWRFSERNWCAIHCDGGITRALWLQASTDPIHVVFSPIESRLVIYHGRTSLSTLNALGLKGTPMDRSNSDAPYWEAHVPIARRDQTPLFGFWHQDWAAMEASRRNAMPKRLPNGTLTVSMIRFPVWLLIIPLAISPARYLWLRYRYRRRLHRNLCVACAFDLSGNVSGVCPECGRTVGRRP